MTDNRTKVTVPLGGTGANNAADARVNLNLGPGDTVTFGNVIVAGSIVSGASLAANVVIQDPILLIANANTGTSDIGFVARRGANANIAWVYDESAATFVAGYTSNSDSENSLVFSSLANISANNLFGNVAASNIYGQLYEITADTGTGEISRGNILSIVGTPGQISTTVSDNVVTVGLSAEGDFTFESNVVVGSDLTVAGNLYVTGNTIIVNTDVVQVEDPIIALANGATGVDAGLWMPHTTTQNVAFIWQTANSLFAFITTDSPKNTASPNTQTYANIRVGNVRAGNIIINGANNDISNGTVDGIRVPDVSNGVSGANTVVLNAFAGTNAGATAANTIINTVSANVQYIRSDSDKTYVNSNAVFGSSTIYIDSLNDRVGIGTDFTPSNTLTVLGNAYLQGNTRFSNSLVVGQASNLSVDGEFGIYNGSPAIYYGGVWINLGVSAIVGALSSSPGRATFYSSANILSGSSFVFFDTSTSRVGIGTVTSGDIDGTLHVYSASAGTITPSTDADDLLIEAAQAGLSIMSQADKFGTVAFASPNGSTQGLIRFDHATNSFAIGSNGTLGVNISRANLGIGIATPAAQLHVVGNAAITTFLGVGTNLFVLRNISVGTSVADSNLHIIGNTHVTGNSTFDSNIFIAQNVVAANGQFSSNVTVGGNVNVSGTLIAGDIQVPSLTLTSNVNAANAKFTGNVSVGANLNVTGNVIVGQNVSAISAIFTQNVLAANGRFTGNVSVGANLNVTGNVIVGQNISAIASSFTQNVLAANGRFVGNVSLAGNLFASGNVIVGSNVIINSNVALHRGDVASSVEYRTNIAGKVLTTDNVWSALGENTLTNAAGTMSWNLDAGIHFYVQLGGNWTMANTTGGRVGQTGHLRVRQNNTTGSNTITWLGNYRFAAQTAPSLSTGANFVDLLNYEVLASNAIFISVAAKNIGLY